MEIRKVGVLGCGLMGSGIAQVAAQSGHATIVREVNQGLLDKGLASIDKFLAKSVEKGKATPEQQAAARKFAQWMTAPERAAQWGIDTGYVAVRPDAWETPAMKKYVADFPAAAVARDQLQYAVAELSTHDNQRVTKALNDGLQAALTGAKTPEQAMKDSQREAERILRPYRK